MVKPGRGTRKRPRITEQQITNMKRLYSEGKTISAIAKEMHVHRQTVAARIAEKHPDIVADSARKKLLGEGLRAHFEQLKEFVRQDIRKQINASAPGETAAPGNIFTTGILGLPYTGAGAPHYIHNEWARIYNPTPREQHLLNSLREHTRDSKLWIHWDRWRKKVSPFENTSRNLWERLGEKLEAEPPDDIRDTETVQSWGFGNIIRVASGRDPAGTETLTQGAEPMEFRPAVYSNPSALSRYARNMMEEANNWPELGPLKSAMSELADSKSQAELRRLAREIDFVLASIELMNAFPGRCDICPV